jgi:hypothetical protein
VVQPPDVIQVLEGLLREFESGGGPMARRTEVGDAR